MNSQDSVENRLRAGVSRHAAWIAFGLFVLAAGSNPVAIRLSNLELPPFSGASLRFAGAALIFWAIVLLRSITLPRGRALIGSLLYGLIGVGTSFAFVYWALVRVPAGAASVFLGMVPLATVLLAAAQGLETLRWRRLVGAAIAVVGIALVAGGGLGTRLTVPLLLALLAFPLAMAEGAVIVKRFPPASPAATNAVSLSIGALMLAGLSFLTGETWSLPATATTWAAFGYLVVIGSVIVFYLWLFILARWPASKTAYGFVLMPVVSIAVSVWLTGEVVTVSLALGAAVALGGVWLGAISGSSHPAPAHPVAGPDLVDCATADC
jgi:drug/metabolite transporter (DMT)-like permease